MPVKTNNRKTRRAAAVAASALIAIPNASGDHRRCDNCAFTMDKELEARIVTARRQRAIASVEPGQPIDPRTLVTANAPDVVTCQQSPQNVSNFGWGFCHQWAAKAKSPKTE